MSRKNWKLRAVATVLTAGVAAVLAPAAMAEKGGCSQPVSSGPDPVATDCLFILRAAVGTNTCSNPCICQPRGVSPTKASDALRCLQYSVGQDVAIDCHCGTPDVESSQYSFDPDTDFQDPDILAGVRARYQKSRFLGAFSQDATEADGDWTQDWTVEVNGNHTVWHPASEGTLSGATPSADGSCPAGTTVAGTTTLPSPFAGSMDLCQLPTRYSTDGGTLTLTNDNVYLLGTSGGGTLIGDGDAAGKTEAGGTKAVNSTLVIEPGTLVLGDIQQALIITRGSKIFANGTRANPISMNSVTQWAAWKTGTDYTGKGVGTGNRREWGGLVLTGFGKADKCNVGAGGTEPCDNVVEGVAVTVNYGGANDAWNAGSVTYVEISNSGYDLGGGNDLNGMTLYTLGYPTIVSHVDVNNAGDDSFEFFGGTVVADHLVATYGLDDNLDTDLGFRGGVQYALIRQATDDGDKCFEADNGPNGDTSAPTYTPRSLPHYANITCINQTTASSSTPVTIGLRTGTGMEIWNMIGINAERAGIRSETADGVVGSTTYAGPSGIDKEFITNTWLYQPTATKGNFEGTNNTDTGNVTTLFNGGANNQIIDPMIDTTTGYPSQTP